jgi:hypothetical protein
MNYLNRYGLLLLTTVLFGSCSKGPYPAAVISLEYVNSSSSMNLYSIRTNPNNINDILDTIFIQELSNNVVKLEVESNQYNYVLITLDGFFRDTITNISFDRVGRRQKIENFNFQFNGVSKSGFQTITIN